MSGPQECDVCYASMADKRRKFPLVTIPKMRQLVRDAHKDAEATAETFKLFNPWLAEEGLGMTSEPRLSLGDAETLHRLHELMRSGVYIYHETPCDCVQVPYRTLTEGGDCDQWAVVGAIAAWLLGFPVAYAVGVGVPEDKYLHVYLMVGGVDAEGEFRYFALDPKGDQEGVDFDLTPDGSWVHTPHVLYEAEDRPAGRFAGGMEKMA